MTRSAKSHYDSLSEAEQRQYCIIHSKGEVIPVIPLQGGDPSDPDLIHRVFQWKFKPRGSGAEVEQCITIDISRSRFEHYRRKPRFNGEWNRYAEEDVPEIRALAAEFQRLHSDQKWSTYNQAFHVLKFVQTCVPYAYDKDTTGYEDWARYPIETLVEGKGDCEDLAVLCAAIIARLGFQTVLLLYPSHVAFGVAGAENLRGDYVEDPRNSNRYFYGEATSDGWHLGQIPKHYQDVRPESILDVRLVVKDE